MNKFYPIKATPQNQHGVALVMTLVVLTALTVAALSLTNSNQTQSIMTKNSQFRLEAFNVSTAEIDAQLDFLNNRSATEGAPDWLTFVLDGEPGQQVSTKSDDDELALPEQSNIPDNFMRKEVAQVFRGNCVLPGFQLGVGTTRIQCNEVIIESTALVENTSIVSDQRQVYEYITPN